MPTRNDHTDPLGTESFVNLDDLWRAMGSPPGKDPAAWLKLDSTREFVQHLADSLGVEPADLIRVVAPGDGAPDDGDLSSDGEDLR
jgi:hypothetical protein